MSYYNNLYQQPNLMQNNFQQRQMLPAYDILWVQGDVGAKAFQMAPGSKAILMDSENDDIFYIKVCDDAGIGKLRRFRYKEEFDTPQQTDMSMYVTKQDLTSEVERLLNSMLGGNSNEQPIQTTQSTKTITK